MSEEKQEYIKVLSRGDENFKEHYIIPQRYVFSSRLTYPYNGSEFHFCLTSPIINGEVGLLSAGERCRETFFSTYKGLLFAAREVSRYQDGKGWATIVNPNFLRGQEITKGNLNVLIPIGLPYPKRKDIREANEAHSNVFLTAARKATKIVNSLEEIAGWEEKSQVFPARPTNMFPKGNCASLLFSGIPYWGNNTYNFSLFLLLCRLTINPLFQQQEDIKDAKALYEFCCDNINDAKALFGHGSKSPWVMQRVPADMEYVIKTYHIWEALIKSYKKVYEHKERKYLLNSPNVYYGGTIGIASLFSNGPQGNFDKELRQEMIKHLAGIPKEVKIPWMPRLDE
jgi:hypothetical protein